MRSPYVSPPIDFPVFGLDDDWTGGRWLAMIEWSSINGAPMVAHGMRLGHGDRHRPLPDRPWAMVTSYDMPRLNDMGSKHYPTDAAARAAISLLDLTQPKLTRREKRRFQDNSIRRAFSEGERFATWPISTWVLDGHPVDAHILRWANTWTGFTMIDDVALVVAGVQIPPASLRVRTQTDALNYHFDLRQPLYYPETMILSQKHASVRTDEAWIDWPRHPDHEALFTDA